MTQRAKKWTKYVLVGFSVITIYVLLVYTYFQFAQFSSSQPDATITDSIWYVFLNPTGLGNTGAHMTFPSSIVARVISFIFVVTGLGLLGAFIGKIGDMFNEYREYRRLGYAGTDFEDHYVVVGWNEFTRLVVEELIESGRQVAVITEKKENIELIYNQFPKDQVFVLFAELQNISKFDNAAVDRAANVLLSPQTDTNALVSLLKISDQYPEPEYVVAIRDLDLTSTLKNAGASHVVARYESSAGLIASQIFEPDSAEYLNDLMTSIRNGEDHEFQQYYVTGESDFAGRKYGDAFKEIHSETRCLPVALYKRSDSGTARRELIRLPSDDTPVEEGDYIVVIVVGRNQSMLEELMGIAQGEQNGDDFLG